MRIAHIDAIVVTEKPKLGPHFPAMRAALALALGIAPEHINLKAKTNEGVDADWPRRSHCRPRRRDIAEA